MSYEQAMRWQKKHRGGIPNLYLGFNTSGIAWKPAKEKPRKPFHVSRGAVAANAWAMRREGYANELIRNYI